MGVRHNADMGRRAAGESPVARQILLLQVGVVVVLVVTAVALAAWCAVTLAWPPAVLDPRPLVPQR